MDGLDGSMLIGGEAVRGNEGEVRSLNAATGQPLEPAFGMGGSDVVDRACALAYAALDPFRATGAALRAEFLDAIAEQIWALGDTLIERALLETGLPRARLEGERGRTMGQLRMFAGVLREGSWAGVRIDPAMPDRTPAPRPDLRLRHIALGPVAVFSASNFPLAFSVAGGDTAAAFAAGCPVIVKAHSAHLGTSVLVAGAVDRARAALGLPPGTFSLLIGGGATLGTALVADPRIKAVGFTGSRSGGTALMATAAARAEPIPVYAEMSSINPVILFPQALAVRGETIARQFVASLTLGAGQFCTNPGLILAVEGPALDAFIATAAAALSETAAATMLTPSIHRAYAGGTERRRGEAELAGEGIAPRGPFEAQGLIFTCSAAQFLDGPSLHDELFGPAALIVACPDVATLHRVIETIEGQLTIALHLDAGDHADAAALLPLIERKAGRILANGFGTGVEVGHAMVHGGPFPATSDGRSTSVGSLAIDRFLRPVSYQDLPSELLPPELQDGNPLGLPRRIDGRIA